MLGNVLWRSSERYGRPSKTPRTHDPSLNRIFWKPSRESRGRDQLSLCVGFGNAPTRRWPDPDQRRARAQTRVRARVVIRRRSNRARRLFATRSCSKKTREAERERERERDARRRMAPRYVSDLSGVPLRIFGHVICVYLCVSLRIFVTGARSGTSAVTRRRRSTSTPRPRTALVIGGVLFRARPRKTAEVLFFSRTRESEARDALGGEREKNCTRRGRG